jgi:hypothetical protein
VTPESTRKRHLLYRYAGYSLTVKVDAKLAPDDGGGPDAPVMKVLLGLIPHSDAEGDHYDVVGVNDRGERLNSEGVTSMFELVRDFLREMHVAPVTHLHATNDTDDGHPLPSWVH